MFFLYIAGILVIIATIVLIRTAFLKVYDPDPGSAPEAAGIDCDDAVRHLCEAVRIQTVSAQCYGANDFTPYEDFISYLEKEYPLFHETCARLRINQYGLVYEWKGSDLDKRPILMMGHYDVVPIGDGTEKDWRYPPFSGEVAEGRIWGRGTLDNKNQVISLLEASQALIKTGFIPARSVYFAFGCDEELGGVNGASKIAEYFGELGFEFDAVYDECGFVAISQVNGKQFRVAQIGVAEKGSCDIKITSEGIGGHSSMPARTTATGNMANAIRELGRNEMAARICPPVWEMLKNFYATKSFCMRMMIANIWLLRPMLIKKLSSVPSDNALLRTTTAVTVLKAGNASNVIPARAEAIVNARILPGNTSQDVLNHITRVTGRSIVSAELLDAREASQVSPVNTYGYEQLSATIVRFFPNAIITPYLVFGGSDSRKYYNVCKNIYRFTPFIVSDREMAAFHNTNESINVEDYRRMVGFYYEFLLSYDQK